MVDPIDLLMPAAGLGTRLGHSLPKQFVLLAGAPIIVHPLRIFAQIPWIGRKIVVHDPSQKSRLEAMMAEHGIDGITWIEGGKTRQESVRRGLAAVQTRRVITHNAAVALVTRALIEQVSAHEVDCVTTATPVQDNMVYGAGRVERLVSRQGMCVINSPQCFVTAVLRRCHERAAADQVAAQSDAELLIHYGHTVQLVPGDFRSFKITTPIDLLMAEALLAHADARA